MLILNQMKKKDFIEWGLIMSHLKGCATEEEEKLFQAWLKADPAHEQYIASAKQAWDDEIKPVNEDYEVSFQELLAKIEHSQCPVIRKRRIRRLLPYVAAACIIAGIFACHYLFHTRPAQEITKEALQLSGYIRPGTAKATLVLDNGRTIPLGDSLINININGVEIKDDSANNLRYHADLTHEVVSNRLIIPRGGEYCVTLADGTVVWLNSESELSYPTAFTGNVRRVELKGEAFFKVAPDKNVPFIVDAGDYHVEVLGTEFNLSAYPEDENKVTTLVKGKVKIGIDRFSDSDTLLPNMQFTYNTEHQSKQITQVNANIYGSWKQGHFEFDHTSLKQFLKIVSRWYDFKYLVKDASLLNYHFTGAFEKGNNIDDLFRILRSSKIPVEISYQSGLVIFDKRRN